MNRLRYLLAGLLVLIALLFNPPSGSAETASPIDLRGLSLENTELLERLLPELEAPREILVDDCGLTDQQIMALADRWPGFRFTWSMTFGGVRFPTDGEEIDLSGIRLKDPRVLERRLKYLPNVKKIILTDCGLDSPTLDALDQRHPDIRFVWTVKLGSLRVRTDETWFMPVKFKATVETKDLEELQYCRDMVCIDIGHMWVHDCQWAANMPNLEYLIIGETRISDLTPLGNLKKLKYLELFTIPVTDYTPLLGCTGMEDLNLGLTYGDPDVIAQMTWLKNLWWCDANGVHDQERRDAVTRMCEALSDTNIAIYIDHPTAGGWRKLPNYYAMRDILGMFYMD